MSAIKIPEILLPKGVDMTRWAVNACDQYTSDEEYWKRLDAFVGDKPSTLRLVYPEIYLKDQPEKRISQINANMHAYLGGGIFDSVEGGFIYVERTTASGTRKGLVLAIDLEAYEFKSGSSALIRSTEATILERIPPRVRIRENAPIELPHVMLLYDDRNNSVLNCVKRGKTLYDFELNADGGHVKGTYVENAAEVTEKFYALAENNDYGNGQKLLFAVGDGNHSLATAKTCWEKIKKGLSAEEAKDHPARFALVEAVNIYDSALSFEPIHRLIKTKKSEKFIQDFKSEGGKTARIITKDKNFAVAFNNDIPNGIRALDDYISEFISREGGEVDYIHGEDELCALASAGVGILLPSIDKSDFFRLIVNGGNLPRKTFSMGEGNEKRYYIEAKYIVRR